MDELQENADKIISAYSKEKEMIEVQIDDLYQKEFEGISLVKTKLNQLSNTYNEFLSKYKERFSKLDDMDVDEVLSLRMNEFYYEEKMLEKGLQEIVFNI